MRTSLPTGRNAGMAELAKSEAKPGPTRRRSSVWECCYGWQQKLGQRAALRTAPARATCVEARRSTFLQAEQPFRGEEQGGRQYGTG
jgi:hypothetical protein